jgi:signal transduction histidine kinase
VIAPKVLVIDDEEIARISCQRVLKREGIDVRLAPSGREGLEMVLQDPPELALVDLKMPEMDGVEVVRRIHAHDPSIVSIIITGYATIESAVAVMKEGAYDYLPKPFTPDELLIVVRRGLEKRRLDQESRALREEKEAMERNFVTMVTHQLRSPLSAIMQYFEVLLANIGGELNDNQREMLERAQERLQGLLDLINDWLDMSRVHAGDIVNRLRPTSVAQCIQTALRALEHAGQDRGITVTSEIPEDLPEIRADLESLREVLANLVANAVNYNRDGGQVLVRARSLGPQVAIEVEDNGYGIDAKEIPFIFDQFYRGKEKRVRQRQGTGLGLAIAQKIVRAHGGTIEVSSELGRGTTFSVRIPTEPGELKAG